MLIAEGLHNINCVKVLPYKLTQYSVAFTMQYPEISMLYDKSIIYQIANLVYSLLAPYTTNINFRFEINITLDQTGIVFPVNLIRLETLLKL